MTSEMPSPITLANLAGGALNECATAELRRICESINDPNTKADAKRKLQITIVVEPDESRQMARITYTVQASTPGPDAGKTMAYLGMGEDKKLGLFEVERHPSLFKEEPLAPIVPLAQRA